MVMNYEGTKLGSVEDPTMRRRGVKLDRWARQVSIAMKAISGGNKPAAKVTTGGGGSSGNPGSGGNLPDHDHHATGFGGNILGAAGATISALGSWIFGNLATFSASIKIPTGAGVGKVLTSDAVGVGSWGTLDASSLPDRVRALWLPASMFSQSNGTAMTLQALSMGLGYPRAVQVWPMLDAPASGPQAVSTTVIIPQDYVAGTTIAVIVHWSEQNAQLADHAWVPRYSYVVVGNKANMAGTWTTTPDVFPDNGATGSGGDYDVGAAYYHAATQMATAIPSTGLAAGNALLLSFDRLASDPSDNLGVTVLFMGLELRYTADM